LASGRASPPCSAWVPITVVLSPFVRPAALGADAGTGAAAVTVASRAPPGRAGAPEVGAITAGMTAAAAATTPAAADKRRETV
jgi:hypothetical protein